MKKTLLISAAVTSSICSLAMGTTTVIFEDFEDSTLTYTASPVDDISDIGNRDYYGRVTDAASPATFSNVQGLAYYAAEDTDGATHVAATITLDWTGFNISGLNGLEFSGFFAEDDDGSAQDWDANSSLLVEYQIDGLGFFNLFAIESSGGTNTEPAEDTNFDGVGNGSAITDTFTQFTKSIAGTGSTLDLRLTITGLDAGDEDIAFDNISVTGVPEPSSAALLGLAGLAVMLRRRR